MYNFLSWYFLSTFLGLITFPLAYQLFPSLRDRGYSLSRALGLLLWGYAFWLLASLGIIKNDSGGLFLTLLIPAALCFFIVRKNIKLSNSKSDDARQTIFQWLKTKYRLVISIELVFFFVFAFMAFVRACNPEAAGTEKPMEMAFINAIMRSPTFPPHDPWLSGYAISYYYFGYVMTAMLAKVTGTLGSIAFNLMSAIVFALSAIGSYGILFNLLSVWREKWRMSHDSGSATLSSLHGLPLLGPFFLLMVSNFEGFFEVLHRFGVFWSLNSDGTRNSAFWSWLGVTELTQPPTLPLGNIPGSMRYYWWWRASRVVQDFDLAGHAVEIIDEFPFFSYLLGDLHPHVLSMPFVLLAIGVALNIILGGWKGQTKLSYFRIEMKPLGILFSGLLVGGLAFLNTWDVLVGLALLTGAFILARVQASGWKWARIADGISFSLPIVFLMVLLYLPFYAGFSSQAGGIMSNLEFPTRGVQIWMMFGPLLIPVFIFFIYLARKEQKRGDWSTGLAIAVGLVIGLWVFSWLLAGVAYIKSPEILLNYLHNDGFSSINKFFQATLIRRILYSGGLVTIMGLVGFPVAFLVCLQKEKNLRGDIRHGKETKSLSDNFVILLILVASLLILTPEFIFLLDQFGNRMNTVFKFYYQAWILLSIAAAFGVAVMVQNLRGLMDWAFRIGLVFVLIMSLCYPMLGLLTKTNNFQIPVFASKLKSAQEIQMASLLKTAALVWTLDGEAIFRNYYPDDMKAADWLRTAPYGNLVESTRREASYSDYSHISTYSGLPTVLGWPMHEGQWRGTYAPQGSRLEDIQRLYETNIWDEAKEIIQKYNIRYIFVGTLEQSTYQVNEAKFQIHLNNIYQSGVVTIYAVP